MRNFEILDEFTNEELEVIVKLIVDKGWQTENLSKDEVYKKYYPDHRKYLDKIKTELSLMGGNTIANIARFILKKNSNVSYREMLKDVCTKMNIKYEQSDTDRDLENCLLATVLTRAFDKLTRTGKDFIFEQMGRNSFYHIFREDEQNAYELSILIANTLVKMEIGKNLKKADEIAVLLDKLKNLVVQVSYILTNTDKTIDIAGPAYRVTLPAIIYIAAMKRIKNKPEIESHSDIPTEKESKSQMQKPYFLVEGMIMHRGWDDLLDMVKKGEFAEWLENMGFEEENRLLEQFFKTENFTDDELIIEICKIFAISKEFLPKHLKDK